MHEEIGVLIIRSAGWRELDLGYTNNGLRFNEPHYETQHLIDFR